MTAPRKLSTVKISPHYDMDAALKVDKVFVDGVHIPNVVAYDMDEGWAFGLKNKCWQPKVHGVVAVVMK